MQSAQTQVSLINDYAYDRFPLMDAFRRQLEGDIPSGSAGLSHNSLGLQSRFFQTYLNIYAGQLEHCNYLYCQELRMLLGLRKQSGRAVEDRVRIDARTVAANRCTGKAV